MASNIDFEAEGSSLLRPNNIKTKEKKKGLRPEEIGDKILMYLLNGFWVSVGFSVLYYSNFFHHFFLNPKINQLFFEICITGYTVLVMLILYAGFILPIFYGINSLEDYNPRLIPVGAVVGVISVISLIIAIWPVWGFTSLLIFIALWKGFFSLSVFISCGKIGIN